MPRYVDEADLLRKCPTCGQECEDIGLRDYSTFLADTLPGRVGATDLDCYIEQQSSNRKLFFEFKPNTYVPRGQRLGFDALASMPGVDFYIVCDRDWQQDQLLIAKVVPGQDLVWHTHTLDNFKRLVRSWWDLGL